MKIERVLFNGVWMLFAVAASASFAADPAKVKGEPLIQSTRAGCIFKKCPADEIHIFADGTLKYRELKFDRDDHEWKTTKLSAAALSALLAQFKAVGFMNMRETREGPNELSDAICRTQHLGSSHCESPFAFSIVLKHEKGKRKINPYLVEKDIGQKLLNLQTSIADSAYTGK